MARRLHRPAAVPALLALAVAACAGSPGTPPVGAASPEVQAAAEARLALETYLEETRNFGTENSTLAYQVVQRGDVLAPALVALLAEVDSDRERYHLIRLGCIGIRGGTIAGEGEGALESALERARSAIRLHTDWRRYADAELRACSAPAERTATLD
jgi:hypothetical protein